MLQALRTLAHAVCLLALGSVARARAATRAARRRRRRCHRRRVARRDDDRHQRASGRSANRDHQRARLIPVRCAARRALRGQRFAWWIRTAHCRSRHRWRRDDARFGAGRLLVLRERDGDRHENRRSRYPVDARGDYGASGKDARADGAQTVERPRRRRAIAHHLAAHRTRAGHHSRHRLEPSFTGSDPSTTIHHGRRLPRTTRDGVRRFSEPGAHRGAARSAGTLYGRNSVGGTINIVSRQPTNAREMSARLTAGDYGALRAEGAISGPLIKDKVMGNFAVHPRHPRWFREGSRSTRTTRLAAEDTWAGRGQMRSCSGPAVSCCCQATMAASTECRSPTPSRLPRSRGSASTARQHVGGADEPSGVGSECPARCLGEADRPGERHDDAEQPDGVARIQPPLTSSTPM